jgi:hypothetical protein
MMAGNSGGDEHAAAANNIRETVKWIIAAFAAPLAIMVGTSPLTNFGSLQGIHLLVASIGGAAGVLVIVYAIKVASNVLVMKTFFLGDISADGKLSTYVDTHGKDLLPAKYTTFEAFMKMRTSLFAAFAQETDKEKKEVLNAKLETVRTITTRIIRLCNYEQMRMSFEKVRLRLLICAVGGAISFGAFAWATAAPGSPPKPPVQVYCGTLGVPAPNH